MEGRGYRDVVEFAVGRVQQLILHGHLRLTVRGARGPATHTVIPISFTFLLFSSFSPLLFSFPSPLFSSFYLRGRKASSEVCRRHFMTAEGMMDPGSLALMTPPLVKACLSIFG